MDYHGAGDAIVGPFARAVNDDSGAATLREAERRCKVLAEQAYIVDPRLSPESARLLWSPQDQSRRAAPTEILKPNRAVGSCAVRCQANANLLNGLAVKVGNGPAQDAVCPRREGHRRTIAIHDA